MRSPACADECKMMREMQISTGRSHGFLRTLLQAGSDGLMKTHIKIPVLQILIPLALYSIFIAGLAYVQFVAPNLADNDGYYHIKLAWIMRKEGLKPEFPWLPKSILNPDEFYDHHFLFHVALIPFTFGDLRLGAKWSAVVFAGLAFLGIWFLLHRRRVPWAWLWALGLLGVSDAFLYRMSIPRAQSLSLGVLALGYLWLVEGKRLRLAVLAFLYVWMYDAFPLLAALGVLHMIAIALVERRFEYRLLLFIGAGMLAGMVINPYFPDNINFSVQHMLPKLLDATAVRVGNEWYPYDTGQLLENSLPALAAFASGVLALGLSNRKMETSAALGLLSALLFGLMLFQARRFVEYFPPFALIFAAFAWSPLLADLRPDPVKNKLPRRTHLKNWFNWAFRAGNPSFRTVLLRIWPVLLLALVVSVSAARSLPAARVRMLAAKPFDLYAGASHWLEQNTPAGALVFQTDWDDFPRLFFYNTHNTYLVGLDPTYMQLYDAGLYDLWVDITRGKVEQPSQVILDAFGARYIHTDLNHGKFIDKASRDPGLKEVYRDNNAAIFEVVIP